MYANGKQATRRIYCDGVYIGFIKDRGGYPGDNFGRFAFCLPGGAVLFSRDTFAECERDARDNWNE